jgi:hypothetical protein
VTICSPAAWLTTIHALSPHSIHHSYNAEKSAAETGGGGLELAGTPTLSRTPPLTTLAHVGEPREVGGRERGSAADIQPARPARLRPQRRGRRGGGGVRRVDCPTTTLLGTPPPAGGGGSRERGGCQGEGGDPERSNRGDPSRMKVNSSSLSVQVKNKPRIRI